jgi:hypothetical protein
MHRKSGAPGPDNRADSAAGGPTVKPSLKWPSTGGSSKVEIGDHHRYRASARRGTRSGTTPRRDGEIGVPPKLDLGFIPNPGTFLANQMKLLRKSFLREKKHCSCVLIRLLLGIGGTTLTARRGRDDEKKNREGSVETSSIARILPGTNGTNKPGFQSRSWDSHVPA